MTGAEVLSRFAQAGYALTLEGEEIRATGPAAPSDELRGLVTEHRDALKVALMLLNPPPWLVRLLAMHATGHVTEVRRVDTATGRAERYPVRLSIENIAAAVGAALGIPRKRWSELLPDVEARVASWEPEEVTPLIVADDADDGKRYLPTWKQKAWTKRDQRESPAGDAYDRMVEKRMREGLKKMRCST
jgi:hypothetical protein